MSHEAQLLKQARQLHEPALAAIYDEFSDGLFRYAYRQLGNTHAAEDCVAETFRRFLHALHAGRGPKDHLQAYLYRIAHNWITDQYRQQRLQNLLLEDLELADAPSNPEEEAAQHLEAARLRRALGALTPDQRQVIALKYLEGWDNAEIAAALKKPIGAVKALQHRALAALRRGLHESI